MRVWGRNVTGKAWREQKKKKTRFHQEPKGASIFKWRWCELFRVFRSRRTGSFCARTTLALMTGRRHRWPAFCSPFYACLQHVDAMREYIRQKVQWRAAGRNQRGWKRTENGRNYVKHRFNYGGKMMERCCCANEALASVATRALSWPFVMMIIRSVLGEQYSVLHICSELSDECPPALAWVQQCTNN